jgi:hypothetical protein
MPKRGNPGGARGAATGLGRGLFGSKKFTYTGANGKPVKAHRTTKVAPTTASKPATSRPRPADDGWSKRPAMTNSAANKALNSRDARKQATMKKRGR